MIGHRLEADMDYLHWDEELDNMWCINSATQEGREERDEINYMVVALLLTYMHIEDSHNLSYPL